MMKPESLSLDAGMDRTLFSVVYVLSLLRDHIRIVFLTKT